MIEVIGLKKAFDDIVAVNNVDLTIREGQVFGLLGTNGAGKSTLLRLLAGILKQDAGSIHMDGQPIWENISKKQDIFYISDDQYFFPNSSATELCEFYRHLYADFDSKQFFALLEMFSLDPKRRIHTFSKGMKKQLSLICGLAANTEYLLCDETFDGLDPVVRHATKSLFADHMARRGLTPVIASHNLRELEDICDSIGLFYQGSLLLSRELVEMKQNLHKVQVIFRNEFHQSFDVEHEQPFSPAENGLDVVSCKTSGSLQTLVIRGEEQEILQQLSAAQPIFLEVLPLTLEEVFISETEVAGYEFKNLAL